MMDKRKQQRIEDLLKNAPLNKAPRDFTSNVMGDLNMLSNEELLKDTKLSSMLKKVPLEQPSAQFVNSVMTVVETKAAFEYQPIINKRTWLFIGGAIIAFISYVFFTAVPTESPSIFSKASPYLERTLSAFEATQSALQNFVQGFQVSSLLAMSLVTLMVLILVDFLSRERSVA